MPEALAQAVEGSSASRTGTLGTLMLPRSSSQSLMTDGWCIYSPALTGVCVLHWSQGSWWDWAPIAYSGNLIDWANFIGCLPFPESLLHCLLKIFSNTNTEINYLYLKLCLSVCFWRALTKTASFSTMYVHHNKKWHLTGKGIQLYCNTGPLGPTNPACEPLWHSGQELGL